MDPRAQTEPWAASAIARPDAAPAGSRWGAAPPTDHPSSSRGTNGTVTRAPGAKAIRSWACASASRAMIDGSWVAGPSGTGVRAARRCAASTRVDSAPAGPSSRAWTAGDVDRPLAAPGSAPAVDGFTACAADDPSSARSATASSPAPTRCAARRSGCTARRSVGAAVHGRTRSSVTGPPRLRSGADRTCGRAGGTIARRSRSGRVRWRQVRSGGVTGTGASPGVRGPGRSLSAGRRPSTRGRRRRRHPCRGPRSARSRPCRSPCTSIVPR